MRTLAISILAAMLAATAAAEAAPLKGGDVVIAPGGLNAPGGKTGLGTGLSVTQIGGTLAPLSADECKGLGGSVVTSSYCNSGSSCQRLDENGTPHEVCLSAK